MSLIHKKPCFARGHTMFNSFKPGEDWYASFNWFTIRLDNSLPLKRKGRQDVSPALASFTKEVNPRLAKRPLKTTGRLANRGLTSLVKEATVTGDVEGKLQCPRLSVSVCMVYSVRQLIAILMYHHMMTSSNENIFRVTGHCAGNSPVTGEFLAQRPVTRSFDVFCDLRLNKRLSK